MTNEERKLALYCLKTNSDFHKEVCEECDMYPSCDHYIQDSVMEKLIEELELEPCDDVISMMDLLNNLHKHFSKGFETDEWWNSTHVLQAVKDCRPELFDLNYVPPVQPKQTECEDAISRKEALEALKQEEPLVWCDGADEIAAYDQWSNDVDTIKNISPVQPKPKTGHWIKENILTCKCSICGKEAIIANWQCILSDYCPNCGSYMKAEQP